MLAFKQLFSYLVSNPTYITVMSFVLQELSYQFERNGINLIERKFKNIFIM